MAIEYIEGDLLSAPEAVIVHGCNSLGKFGSGFAEALKAAHPAARSAYLDTYRDAGLVLGSVIWAQSGRVLIGNCVTQATYGKDGKRHVSYEALRSCMRTVNSAAVEGVPGTPFEEGFTRVAMPLIGADLAGGDWSVIAAIIEDEIRDVRAAVYYLPGKEPILKRAGVRL